MLYYGSLTAVSTQSQQLSTIHAYFLLESQPSMNWLGSSCFPQSFKSGFRCLVAAPFDQQKVKETEDQTGRVHMGIVLK